MSDAVQIRLDQAYQARAEGRIADARDAYAGAAALAREARLPLPRAHALRHLSDIDREAGRPDQALSHAEQAIALYRRSLGAPLDLANAVRLAGLALDDLGRQEAAAAHWTEARRFTAMPGCRKAWPKPIAGWPETGGAPVVGAARHFGQTARAVRGRRRCARDYWP